MIYLDTKSLEIGHTKGRPTKSEPAFSIPSPTPSTKKSDFQKKLRVALSITTNKTYQYRYSSSSKSHLSNFSLLEGKASL